MKKIFYIALALIIGTSCNHSHPAVNTTPKNADSKILYEKNLNDLKTGITAFENKKIEDWAATVSDTTIWNAAGYGSSPQGKQEWKKSLTEYINDWDSLTLRNPDFLPGLDSATHEFDGSVRYYGEWVGIHKSGVRTSVNFYATYDFNKDGKIINASEFYDVGGLTNSLKKK